jgi:hypothetical protein
MQVKNAIKALKQLPMDEEICIQWYDKEDLSNGDDVISDEVWFEANLIFDNWEFTDMRYALDDAIRKAKTNLQLKTGEKYGSKNKLSLQARG